MLESYVQALIKLISSGKITVDGIKNETYKAEVQTRLSATQ